MKLKMCELHARLFRTIVSVLLLDLVSHLAIAQELNPVGAGVCPFTTSRLDTIIVSSIQSRVVPYNGACAWLQVSGCQVYKVTFQPVYKRTTRVNYITEFRCCKGWVQVGRYCQIEDPNIIMESSRRRKTVQLQNLQIAGGPNMPSGAFPPVQGPGGNYPGRPRPTSVPGLPGRPGVASGGNRGGPNPGYGLGHGGFGPGAGFVPRPGFGRGTGIPAERPNYEPGYGPGPGVATNPRPETPGTGPGISTSGGTGTAYGPGPDRGTQTTNTGTNTGPNTGTNPSVGGQSPMAPPPQEPGVGVGGRGRTNNAGTGTAPRPGQIPGRNPGQEPGQGEGGDSDQLPNTKSKSGSLVTILGALLGIFGIFGLGGVLMMFFGRKREGGQESVRLRRPSFRDAAGRESEESHKSWKFSIYQFRLQ